MKLIFEMLVVSFMFIVVYFLSHDVFYVCFRDDVEFNYGKKRMKNRRKKEKGFWRKFLFLDIRKEVIPWHYVMFWINLVSFIATLIVFNIFIASNNETLRIVFEIVGGIYFLTTTIIAFVRWPLYAGNKVRCRKKYRKNNRP